MGFPQVRLDGLKRSLSDCIRVEQILNFDRRSAPISAPVGDYVAPDRNRLCGGARQFRYQPPALFTAGLHC